MEMKKPTATPQSIVPVIAVCLAFGALMAYFTRAELHVSRVEQQIAAMQARQERALLLHFHDVRQHLAQLLLLGKSDVEDTLVVDTLEEEEEDDDEQRR